MELTHDITPESVHHFKWAIRWKDKTSAAPKAQSIELIVINVAFYVSHVHWKRFLCIH